jgi:hypothetical protein
MTSNVNVQLMMHHTVELINIRYLSYPVAGIIVFRSVLQSFESKGSVPYCLDIVTAFSFGCYLNWQ